MFYPLSNGDVFDVVILGSFVGIQSNFVHSKRNKVIDVPEAMGRTEYLRML